MERNVLNRRAMVSPFWDVEISKWDEMGEIAERFLRSPT
jgi:hypothetical protein